jgi:hypothetical protein
VVTDAEERPVCFATSTQPPLREPMVLPAGLIYEGQAEIRGNEARRVQEGWKGGEKADMVSVDLRKGRHKEAQKKRVLTIGLVVLTSV